MPQTALTLASTPRRRSLFTLALALLLAAACGTSAAPSGASVVPSVWPTLSPLSDARSPLIPVAGYRSTLTALTSVGIARLSEVGGRQHNSGTTFTGNPALLRVIKDAGFDFLSLANNHIGDGGILRIPETVAAVKAAGMQSGGAGANLAEAQRPWLTEVGGITVGIVAVDQINPSYHARANRAGSAPIGVNEMRASIAAARAAGADFVIVFPHWGIEFQAQPTASQRRFAKGAINAGADMVLGSHSHWASAMEIIDGKPVFYSMGNFVFDQNWSVETSEGIVIESTFAGSRLVSTRMLPTVILNQSQPNFVDVGTDGTPIMNRVWKGSKGLPRW